MKSVVLAEKPSVARDIARVLKCSEKINGALEGNQYVVTWALGHLVTLADPEEYDKKYNTEYMNSLMKFVEAGGNYAEAARKLALHVNSVRYRINRIREDFFPDQSPQRLKARI